LVVAKLGIMVVSGMRETLAKATLTQQQQYWATGK